MTHTFSKNFDYPFPDGTGLIRLAASLTPTLSFSFSYDFNVVDVFAANSLGFKLDMDMSLHLTGNLDLSDGTKQMPTMALVDDETLKLFVIHLGEIPIPGRLSLHIDEQVSVEVKDVVYVSAHLEGGANMAVSYSYQWSNSAGSSSSMETNGPNLDGFDFYLSDFKENMPDASLVLRDTITPTVSFKIPSTLSDADLNKLVKSLPAWLQNSKLIAKVKQTLNDLVVLKLSATMPVSMDGVLKLCSQDCAANENTPVSVSLSASVQDPKASLTFFKMSKSESLALHAVSEPIEYCLPKPVYITCDDVDLAGHCICKCPDGTPPRLVDGKYKCPCKCKDGRESKQRPDGKCDCKCKCPNGAKSEVDALGCPCPCKCKNCQQSLKYLDKNGRVLMRLPNANEEGCICGKDKTESECRWVECELKCRRCPGDPSCTPRRDQSHGFGDVHFITFDQRAFDFMGLGEYTFCMDPTNDFGVQFRALKFDKVK